jgi:hypothetical protein
VPWQPRVSERSERRWRNGGDAEDAEDLEGDVELNRGVERKENMGRREMQKGNKMNEECCGLASEGLSHGRGTRCVERVRQQAAVS